jgi:hypothetical protein
VLRSVTPEIVPGKCAILFEHVSERRAHRRVELATEPLPRTRRSVSKTAFNCWGAVQSNCNAPLLTNGELVVPPTLAALGAGDLLSIRSSCMCVASPRVPPQAGICLLVTSAHAGSI